MWRLWPPFLKIFATPLFHRYFRWKTEHLRMCRSFFALPIRAALTIVVVEDIELDPSNHLAWEGLRLPKYGPPTEEVTHPWFTLTVTQSSSVKLAAQIKGL